MSCIILLLLVHKERKQPVFIRAKGIGCGSGISGCLLRSFGGGFSENLNADFRCVGFLCRRAGGIGVVFRHLCLLLRFGGSLSFCYRDCCNVHVPAPLHIAELATGIGNDDTLLVDDVGFRTHRRVLDVFQILAVIAPIHRIGLASDTILLAQLHHCSHPLFLVLVQEERKFAVFIGTKSECSSPGVTHALFKGFVGSSLYRRNLNFDFRDRLQVVFYGDLYRQRILVAERRLLSVLGGQNTLFFRLFDLSVVVHDFQLAIRIYAVALLHAEVAVGHFFDKQFAVVVDFAVFLGGFISRSSAVAGNNCSSQNTISFLPSAAITRYPRFLQEPLVCCTDSRRRPL
nr:MAG TPA: hypothetical protein [Bacteriophage sp.]